MKSLFKTILPTGLLLFLTKVTLAHCPLCTVGAGALAVLAASLGISTVVVGIMIGAFSLALGYWIAPMVKKEYFPMQKQILILLIFFGTVIPIMPLIREFAPLYVSIAGDYGGLLHNTYTIDLYILGVVIGAIVMWISPLLSKLMTKLLGTQYPYQGLSITLALLILISLITQMLS